MLSTLEVLRSARKLLSDPKRWSKGKWHGRNETKDYMIVDCYCAEGAIAAACGIDIPVGGSIGTVRTGLSDEQRKAFLDACGSLKLNAGTKTDYWEREVPVIRGDIPSWNDAYETRYEDVMEVFSKACEAEFAASEQEVAVP